MIRTRIYNRINMPSGLEQSKRRFFSRSTGKTFDVHAAAQDGVTEIDLYDEIGYWGVTAGMLRRELRGAGDVRLRIHSPGGDVYDGIAMYNDLLEHPGNVEVQIPGLAASAASLIAMAGDDIIISPTAQIMIHNVWSLIVGDRHDLLDAASIMEKLDASLADVYAARGSLKRSEYVALMDADTFMSADEAVSAGLADSIKPMAKPKAKYDLSAFKNAPKEWALDPEDPAQPVTIRDYEQVLTSRDAKLSLSQAKALLSHGYHGMREAAMSRAVTRDADDDQLITFDKFIEEIRNECT